MKKQSPKGEDMNKLKQLHEIINKVKLKSTDGATLTTLNEGEKISSSSFTYLVPQSKKKTSREKN